MVADVRPMKTAAEAALAANFLASREGFPGTAFAPLREEAFRRFEIEGLPHRRVEAWKYTDLRALLREAHPLALPPDAAAKAMAGQAAAALASIEARRIVFVDGSFVPELSDLSGLEPGVAIAPMAAALAAGDPVLAARLGNAVPTDDIAVALNTAFMRDGALIRIGEGVTLARPIHLIFFNGGAQPSSVFARSLIVVGKNARAMIVESHEGRADSRHQVNSALEMTVGDGAHVDHVKIAGTGAGALHISSLMAALGARVRFNAFVFTAGGAIVRSQVFVQFNGKQTLANIRGASLLNGRQHGDITMVADHAAGGSTSREVFKAVVDDEGRSAFQGKIIVRPDAQSTDARMATHALLMSPNAEADSKPELEIFADDVQCGHGATVGALDEDLLFYLKARGIPAREAEALMIEAFIGEAVDGIEHAGLRDALMEQVHEWLKARS